MADRPPAHNDRGPAAPAHPVAKRPRSPSPPAKRRAGVVATHYNARPNSDVRTRTESPIYQLKCFNNWAKAVQCMRFLRRGDTVLDLGCGKGGDLQKYNRASLRALYGFDVASVSIEQARERYASMRRAPFHATFTTLDCFHESIEPHLPPDVRFDAVAMQFCMHYAFDCEESVRRMLANVTCRLRPGGYFFGNVPHANVLVQKLRAAEGLEFGNSKYRVRFSHKSSWPVYGHAYTFMLEDAIDECPEYLVHWPTFTRLARDEYGLELVEAVNLHEFYRMHCAKYADMALRMRVVAPHAPTVSQDEWEAIGLYMAFAFRKV